MAKTVGAHRAREMGWAEMGWDGVRRMGCDGMGGWDGSGGMACDEKAWGGIGHDGVG